MGGFSFSVISKIRLIVGASGWRCHLPRGSFATSFRNNKDLASSTWTPYFRNSLSDGLGSLFFFCGCFYARAQANRHTYRHIKKKNIYIYIDRCVAGDTKVLFRSSPPPFLRSLVSESRIWCTRKATDQQVHRAHTAASPVC